MSINAKVETITPELAHKYLKNNFDNRPIRRSWVEQLAGLIQRGQWSTTHQGIAFDLNGRLVDGQHRLHAICESGLPVEMQVTRGLDKDVFRHIDAGRHRTIGDRLKLLTDPVQNQKCCAIVRVYGVIATGKGQMTTDLIDNLFLSMPDEFAAVAEGFTPPVQGLTRSEVAAAIAVYMTTHASEARYFMDGYLSGEGFRKSDAPFALREAILTGRIRPGIGGGVYEGYWKAIYATQAHCDGKPLSRMDTAKKDWRGNENRPLILARKRKGEAISETVAASNAASPLRKVK